MTGVGSKRKGARYELRIAKAFRHALGLSSESCFRTPQSGGHAQFEGADITFRGPAERLRLSVECKHVAAARLSHLLRADPPAGELWTRWLEQATDAAGNEGRPILVARVARRDMAVVRANTLPLRPEAPRLQFRRVGWIWELAELEHVLNALRIEWLRSAAE